MSVMRVITIDDDVAERAFAEWIRQVKSGEWPVTEDPREHAQTFFRFVDEIEKKDRENALARNQ